MCAVGKFKLQSVAADSMYARVLLQGNDNVWCVNLLCDLCTNMITDLSSASVTAVLRLYMGYLLLTQWTHDVIITV